MLNPPTYDPRGFLYGAAVHGMGVLPTALGGEKKSRIVLLKGKLSSLKGKTFRRETTAVAPGEIKPPEKVTEIPLKPAPAPAPEKKVEAPNPASKTAKKSTKKASKKATKKLG